MDVLILPWRWYVAPDQRLDICVSDLWDPLQEKQRISTNPSLSFSGELTWNIGPLGRGETVFTLHYIAKHHHLLAMPERRAAHEQGEHNDAAGPTAKRQVWRNDADLLFRVSLCAYIHVHLLWIARRALEHVALERLRRQITRCAAQICVCV